jgi:acetyltransferase-like isoleucine patch superfamily enzyme
LRRMRPRNLAVLIRYLRLRVRCPKFRARPFFIGPRSTFDVNENADVTIGRRLTLLRDFDGRFKGELVIGDDVWFSPGCTLAVHRSVSIGSNCVFAEYVSIHDNNHAAGALQEPLAARGFETAPIRIGRNVWVGAKATILMGVTIGDNAIVGANSVVTRDVPAGATVAGAPARELDPARTPPGALPAETAAGS